MVHVTVLPVSTVFLTCRGSQGVRTQQSSAGGSGQEFQDKVCTKCVPPLEEPNSGKIQYHKLMLSSAMAWQIDTMYVYSKLEGDPTCTSTFCDRLKGMMLQLLLSTRGKHFRHAIWVGT